MTPLLRAGYSSIILSYLCLRATHHDNIIFHNKKAIALISRTSAITVSLANSYGNEHTPIAYAVRCKINQLILRRSLCKGWTFDGRLFDRK